MKLRNKKNGEILDDVQYRNFSMHDGFGLRNQDGKEYYYHSLAELNEEWEDYKPAEPLIKDEKIRKAVRAWADNLRESMCDGEITFYVDNPYCTFQADVWKNYNNRTIAEIDLVFDHNELDNGELDNGKIYTIAELCGEEEE